jgi:large subunit ribosomal protein L3
MTIGLVGRKAGMTRVFTDAGDALPVTVIEALPNRIVQVKDSKAEGYRAIQVTFGNRRASRLSKPVAAHFAKPGVLPGEGLVEFRLAEGEGADLKAGTEIKVDIFQAGQDGFAGGYASHGASVCHRSPGSIGQRQTPGRVFPGKRMAGRMGGTRRTEENLKVVQVDVERNLLLVSGSVPGAPGGRLVIRPSVKAAARARRKSVAAVKK